MTAKTHGELHLQETRKKQIRVLAAILIFAALFLSIGVSPASAYNSTYKLMVFTDKQVYLDFGYAIPDAGGPPTTFTYVANANFSQNVNLFALLLDSDGNIVRTGLSGSNFSATLKDIALLNHTTSVPDPYINVIPTNGGNGGAYYSGAFPAFTDADGDGIYNSFKVNQDLLQNASRPPLTDHLNISINVTVKYQGKNYTSNITILFGNAGCRHPGNAITSAHGKANHDDVLCTVCHWGYQYNLGVHGQNNSLMNSDPARYTGAPLWTTYDTAPYYDYRLGYRNLTASSPISTWDNSNAGYCVMCHGGPKNANILDLGVGTAPASTDQNADTLNDVNRPSCSWYQGPLGNNSAYPGCHAPQTGDNGSTKIAAAQLFNVDWKGWTSGAAASKVHNHSNPPRTNGTPCELCHAGGGAPGTGTGGMHSVAGLPNRSTEYVSVNDQCWNCHNRTDGWLNITANGGSAMNHSRTDKCSNCHNENNRLDVHRVPTGAFGGRWCLNCHNITGKAPIDHKIDPAIANISNPDYIHANLNNRSDALNSSRICWGCHTNDTLVVNGRVNSTGIPLNEHPESFDRPRNCIMCHNNSNKTFNFGAPQTYRHTWYAPTMKTPAVTYCVNCHAQEEMVNKWSEGVYPPKSDNESASHYGKNRSSYFEPLIGTRQYCGYCHQNESTVMGPFAKTGNKVRSDHASKPNTPGCGNATCHRRGRMHEDTLVIPNFTESNISTTCLSCHNPANYNFHNGTLTCWDCHMGNVSSDNPMWIHPIQFVQYNGNYTGAKLTGATCYNCHKSDRVDNTIKILSGKTPPKIYSQSHSNDPMNGTKWGDYWKYTPRTYEFADYKLLGGYGEIDPARPFENIMVPSNDYMQLNETQNGSNNGGTFPYSIAEQDINGPPVPNWTYSSRINAGTSTIFSTQDAYYGNPAGSLKGLLKTSSNSGSGTVSWNYSFYYKPNSTQFAYTNASVDYFINVSTARTQTIYFKLIKPSGISVNLANASCCAAAGNSSWVTLRNDSFGEYLDEDGSVTPYKIQLYAELSAARPNTNTYTVYFDNIRLKFHEKVWNRYEIIINTTGIPLTGSSKLGMSYQMHMENATLMIYNRTLRDYEYLDTMYQGVFFDYVKDINSTYHIDPTGNGTTGNVSIKLIDDDRSDIDEVSDVMHIRYMYIFTDQGLQFPCEQCHSPNKHYVNPPIGSPSKFSAGNNVNQSISTTGTWCQQCHWQGSANYSKMLQEFSVTRVPPENIPPEITGNATYAPLGGARDGTPYQNHNGFDLSDAGCFGCHGGKLKPDAGMTAFIHGVSEGVGGGGRNCTSCHFIGGSVNNINATAVGMSIHATLNSGAISSPQNATNKPCWGCHGTLNGSYANESDQPASGHNTSVYKNPRKCYDCHITGSLKLTTKNVTDHISPGSTALTDVKTSAYCSICHNNSVNNGYEPDAMGITGGSPINASVSHYGSKSALIETIGDVNTSQGCIYCHYDPNNSAAWGSAIDPRTSIIRPHVETQNSQCWGCHVQGALPPTFHSETLFAGGGGGIAPPVPSGSPKLLVATNRYVILDDWNTAGTTGTGFSLPGATHASNSWTKINTRINATALYMDDMGSPLTGKIITFNLYMPNGTELAAARVNATTDGNGLATFSFDMDARNYYGNWTLRATNGSFTDNTGFIYNWWGCGIAGCNSGHATSDPSGAATINSPYLSGRDPTTNIISNHNTVCTNCHQSFDGKPGGNAAGGANHTNNASDVHRNITCTNSNCHGTITTHNTNQVIGSCYGSACHTPANRSDISNKSTLNGAGLSLYSFENGSTFNSTFHTPNSTVPCFICHGPMHNITKPDETQRFVRNNVTESSQCITCHLNRSHSQNKAVDCSMCHSPDAHGPKYITNQTTAAVPNYTASRSSAAKCEDCHNNSGINSYFNTKGYSPKKNDSYGFNVTPHNNVVSCNTCHDRLHWTGYMNSTGIYQPAAAGAIVCLDCHSGTNANVSGTVSYWGYMAPARSRHNNSVPCESCHSSSKHGIRFLQPDRVSFGSKLNPVACVNCHQQGYTGAPRIPAPLNHSTNPYSGALWNGTQNRFWDNTSQLTACYYCHGSVLHSTSPLGEVGKVKGTNNLNQSLTNGYWCASCHYKNAPGYGGNLLPVQPPEVLNKSGLVPAMARDGTGFFNHSNDLSAGYDDARCRNCHNNNLGTFATSLDFSHNVGTGSAGGSNCTSCHYIGGSVNNVNVTAIGGSMHATINGGAVSSPQNAVNKPCWGCHGTLNGSYANESDQPVNGHNISVYKSPRQCGDCHITGRLLFTTKNVTDHISSGYTPETDVNTSSYNPGYCSYCHNNSVNNGYEPDSMGITGGSPINASVSHYGANKTGNMMMAPGVNSTECVYCHRNSSNMITWGILPQTPVNISNKNVSGGGTDHTLYTSSSQCSTCHGGFTVTPVFTFHNGALGNGSGASGGPNCKICHDVTGPQKKVNFSAMNDSDAVHLNLNRGAFASDNAYNESKKCWACHGDGSQPSGHPARFKTPSNCTDCHVNLSSPFGALQVSQHFWNGTNIRTPASNNCYICHNTTGMIIPAYDPDGQGSVYGGANGGNDSVSHYGRKRNDMAAQQNTTAYCNNCHNGVSAFPFFDSANRTISNHSTYATNPACRDCHDGGRLHNGTLYMASLTTPNSTYCLSCHGNPGSGGTTIRNLERHNGTGTNCTGCHLDSSKGIHPAKYLQTDSSWNISKTNAVNCTSCHQGTLSGFGTAPLVPKRMNHSTNFYSGNLWSGSQPAYWSNVSQQNNCDYCHGRISLHNLSGLGNITAVRGTNNVRQNLSTGRWCANCHYAGSPEYAGSSFYQQPPEILNASGKVPPVARDNTMFYNHSSDVKSGYNDSVCKKCHNNSLAAGATSLDFSHNLAPGAGAPNCTACHYTGSGVQNINVTALNDINSIHSGLNKGAAATDSGYNASKSCWACHGDGSQPESHPSRYKSPSNCTDCHINSSSPFGALQVSQHFWNGTNIRTPASNNCYICHNATGMIIPAYDPDGKGSVYGGANGGNDSVSHYGLKRNDMAAQQNTTSYCNNCHNGASAFPFTDSANRTISNHSSYPTNPACSDCHDGGRLHNGTLFVTSLTLPNSTYCLSCHGNPGSAGTTIRNLERHNGTGTQCTNCHLNSSKSIHPARYLQQDSTWTAFRLFAVNCTSCHQAGMGGFNSAPRVPALAHSINSYSGALWNGTQPGFWDNRSQQSACDYCHGNGALHNASGQGNITKVKGMNKVRQGLSGGYWCANCHYSTTANYSGSGFTPQPPEVKNSSGLVPQAANDGTQFYNHSNDLASGYDDAKCRSCHDNSLGASATSANFTHSLGTGGGGPNCISCHGTGGSLADGKRINQSAMNRSDAVHKDLNRNAAISDVNLSENRKCWACHGDGTEPSGHPARYKNPYACIECHVDGQVTSYNPNNTILNVNQHYWNGTSITTSSATTCYICHNKSEMMTGLNPDPDGAGTIGAGNGGNGSVSHYGKKRSDMASLDNTSYCNYCHNNISSAFPFANATNNKTISNHSMNYPASNPACSACHSSGRLHSSALFKPAFYITNGTYCLSCHGRNGSGGTNYTGSVTGLKEEHNDSLCTECHLNSTKNIHLVRYLRQNGTWALTNSSAVNCTSCHQGSGIGGFGSAPLVQTPIWHSNNTVSGALWNGTQPRYWDNRSQQSACDYCHGKESIHNSSGLGRSVLIQGTNLKNHSLGGSYWCANCHYKGAAPSGKYYYKGDMLNPVPPEIFNLTGLVPANSSTGIPFQNHTTNIGGDWSDSRCKNCHGKELTVDTTSATFVHRLNQSAAETGGPDCLKCHASTATMTESEGTPLDMRVNKTAFITYSVHRDMNSEAVSTVVLSDNRSKACWVCHGDGTQPIKHPVDYMTPKECKSCHVYGNATPMFSHYPGYVFLGTVIYNSTDPNRTCASCHYNSIVANLNITYGSAGTSRIKNASSSHYALNRTTGASIGNAATGTLPNTTSPNGCRECHNVRGTPYGAYGPDYGNARDVASTHNSMSSSPVDCETGCHNSKFDGTNLSVSVSLHNQSVGINTAACYYPGCHVPPPPCVECSR